MKGLTAKRVEGKGQASKNGFPTINVQYDLGSIEEGVWLCYTHIGGGWSRSEYECIASVSEYKGALCTEIHVLGSLRLPVQVGESVTVYFIKKLRDKLTKIDPVEQIKKDIDLAHSTDLRTCESCERYFSKDYGYSNYTVEGTEYGCYANYYETLEDNDVNKYCASNCPLYKKGEMWVLDCDGEEPEPTEDWYRQMNADIRTVKLVKLLQ